MRCISFDIPRYFGIRLPYPRSRAPPSLLYSISYYFILFRCSRSELYSVRLSDNNSCLLPWLTLDEVLIVLSTLLLLLLTKYFNSMIRMNFMNSDGGGWECQTN